MEQAKEDKRIEDHHDYYDDDTDDLYLGFGGLAATYWLPYMLVYIGTMIKKERYQKYLRLVKGHPLFYQKNLKI